MSTHFDVHGLVLRSDVPLAGYRQVDAQPDLTVIHRGTRLVPHDEPDGQQLQAVVSPHGPLYRTARRASGQVTLRLHGTADFDIDPETGVVEAWSDPTCSKELLGILIAGNLLATVLALRGETVLHASAVEIDGRVLAFVADSGMGKSTMAALCTARGASFLTDDVLRPFRRGNEIWCHPGGRENRLRRSVSDLVPETPGIATRESVDGRIVWSPSSTREEASILTAIVLPQPDRTNDQLGLELLKPSEALLELARRPRLLGWFDPEVNTQTFRNLAAIVREVSVFRAHVPWGPPFSPCVVDELLSRTIKQV